MASTVSGTDYWGKPKRAPHELVELKRCLSVCMYICILYVCMYVRMYVQVIRKWLLLSQLLLLAVAECQKRYKTKMRRNRALKLYKYMVCWENINTTR